MCIAPEFPRNKCVYNVTFCFAIILTNVQVPAGFSSFSINLRDILCDNRAESWNDVVKPLFPVNMLLSTAKIYDLSNNYSWFWKSDEIWHLIDIAQISEIDEIAGNANSRSIFIQKIDFDGSKWFNFQNSSKINFLPQGSIRKW